MVEHLLAGVIDWATAYPGIGAVALVGSHARGTAGPDSDVDLVILTPDAEQYIDGTAWVADFARAAGLSTPEQVQVEDYGAVTSLRVHFAAGPELEFGFALPSWAERPYDPGTVEVVSAGMRMLYDPARLLGSMTDDIRQQRLR